MTLPEDVAIHSEGFNYHVLLGYVSEHALPHPRGDTDDGFGVGRSMYRRLVLRFRSRELSGNRGIKVLIWIKVHVH